MDMTPNKYDSLILKITTISPTARDVLEGEVYRLRLETDDVDSEAVLEEMIIALRDDLAAIGLYLKGPLADLYTNFTVLNTVLETLTYIFPATLYLKIRDIAEIRPAIQDILNGGVGDESTLILYLNWLGRTEGCFDPDCKAGADWLAEYVTATPLFDIYLTNLIAVQSTLDHPEVLSPEDHTRYIAMVREKAHRMYDALACLEPVIQDETIAINLHRRISLFIRSLTQPEGQAERAWLMLADPTNLSEDLQAFYTRRLIEFQKSQKLYGLYYAENPVISITPFIILGIAIRLWSDLGNVDRNVYMDALIKELVTTGPNTTPRTLSVFLHSLVVQIVSILFAPAPITEVLRDV